MTNSPKTEWDYMKTLTHRFVNFAFSNNLLDEDEFRLMTTVGELETTVTFTKFLERLLPHFQQIDELIRETTKIREVLNCTNHGLNVIFPVEGDEIGLLWFKIQTIVAAIETHTSGHRISNLISEKFNELYMDNANDQIFTIQDALVLLLNALTVLRMIRTSLSSKKTD